MQTFVTIEMEDGGVLQGSGTIQLCPVAMGETAVIPFTGYARSYGEDG